MSKKIILSILLFVLVLGMLAALGVSTGVIDLPFNGHLVFDDGFEDAGMLGSLLGVTIAGIVLLFVGVLLLAVFAGVSLVLLAVAVIVGVVLLVVSLPLLLPAVALIAVPLMILYGLLRHVTRANHAAQSV